MNKSVFIHYNEIRKAEGSDYVATHAMIVNAQDFGDSGGFAEGFLSILEDVEFSHRMKRNGYRLLMDPAVQMKHIFGLSLVRSMQNAFKKSMFWTAYSIENKVLFKDSGAASSGLKLNTAAWLINVLIVMLFAMSGEILFLPAMRNTD